MALLVHYLTGMKYVVTSGSTAWAFASRSEHCCLLLTACGADAVPGDDSTPPVGEPAVTYWQDVEPIFYTNCQSCHTAGGIAPFAIDDPETAIVFAPIIAEQTASRLMPPWPPGGDTPPLAHVRTLTQTQIDDRRVGCGWFAARRSGETAAARRARGDRHRSDRARL